MNTKRYFIYFSAIVFGLLIAACRPAEPTPTTEPQAGLANPASVHCEEQGGRLEMRQDESGRTYGICIFEDGSECEEWAFFNGDCRPGDQQQAEEGLNSVNVVEGAGLADTVALEIRELSYEPAEEPYVHLLTIEDEADLAAIVQALNVNIRPGPRLACIPIYQLHFHLADGRTVALEYSCGEGAGTFMRGETPLAEGEDYLPLGAFNELIIEHIQSTWAQSIRPVALPHA